MKIGQLIKEQRQVKRVSLQKIAKALCIKPKYLTAIEEDNVDLFSSKVYYQGYLRQYVKYLGLNVIDLDLQLAGAEKELIIAIPEADRYNPSALLAFLSLCICFLIYNFCSNLIC